MKPLLGTLFLVVLAALLPAAIVLADSDDDVRVEAAASPALATEDHDLAAASFGPLFVDKSISGDTIAFAFEITNLGKLADTGDWRIVSNNTTSDLADDILIASGSAGLDPGFSLRSGPAGISWNTMGAKLGTHTVTLSVGQVPGETTIANNKKDLVVVLVDRPTHDVAVTGITPTKEDGSPLGTGQLPSGAKINVNVTTRNRGSVTETFGLTLTAAQGTTTREVSRVNVTLDSGDELTLGLVWDTLGAKPGTQKLTATAAVSGDEDTSNDSSTADVDITIVLAQIDIQGADGLFPADPSNAPLVMKNPRLTTTVNALSAPLHPQS